MARPRKNADKAQNSLLTPDEVAEVPVEEQPYPLPEGWKWVRLGDALHLQAGKNISARDIHSEKTDEFPYPCFGGNGIRGYVSEYNREGNFPLIGRQGALCGNIKFASGKFYATEHAVAVSGKLPHEITWVSYCLRNMNLNQYATATAQPGLAVSTLNQLPFPYPPFGEQQRIVDRIESLFAKLDEAKAKAEAVLDGFEIRKAAILHKAFTGELTAKWREIRGIKKENNTVKIKDILSDIKYGTSEKSDYTYTGLPVIRIPNITGSSVDLEDLKFLKSSKSSDYDLVERNDILMIRSNGSRELVGKCALVDEAIVGKAYASFLIRLRPNPTINPKYLLGFLNSSLARNQLFAKAKSSAGIHNINSKEICSVDIWLPDKKEQQEIVRILDNLLAKERHIREAAENALSQIDLMKKAILARAFRGELGTHGSARDTLQNNGSM